MISAVGVVLASTATASPFVLVTTLSAAVAHATWNSIAHGIKDKLVSFTLVSLGGMICAVPLVLLAAAPSSRSWDYLGVSVALHIAYTVLLMASYRLGDFSQTYPLARGTSPLVVLALAAVFAGENPGPGQFAGVALICAGWARWCCPAAGPVVTTSGPCWPPSPPAFPSPATPPWTVSGSGCPTA